MRSYGRIVNEDGSRSWVEVSTAPDGTNDSVWLLTLFQCLLLILGESPFDANYGIPAQQSVLQQVFPDFYVFQTQSQFVKYFAALVISKITDPTPTYRVAVTTNAGVQLLSDLPI